MICSVPSSDTLPAGLNKQARLKHNKQRRGPRDQHLAAQLFFQKQTSRRTGTWPGALRRRKASAVRATSAGRSRKGSTWCALPLAEQHLRKARQTLKAVSC